MVVLDELASLQRLPQLHTALTENRKSNNPVVIGFQGRSQLEVRYGHEAEAMLSQPATKVFLHTSEPRAAKWISDTIGEVEIERLKEAVSKEQFPHMRRSKSYYTERRTEPLVLPSEIGGMPRMHAFAKVDNLVVRFSFPYVELRKTQPGFIARNYETHHAVIDAGSQTPQPNAQPVQEIRPDKATGVAAGQEPFFGVGHADDFEGVERVASRDLSQRGIRERAGELLLGRRKHKGRVARQTCRAVGPPRRGRPGAIRAAGEWPASGHGRTVGAPYDAAGVFGRPRRDRPADGAPRRLGCDVLRPEERISDGIGGGDDDVRQAHRESVRVAIDELEKYVQARMGGNRPAETTGKWVAASFEHDSARPVEGYAAPQLHTHVVFFNLTETEKGESRALQPRELYRSQQYGTAIYRSELALRLRELGYEIEQGKSCQPEIRGYTHEYLEASSPRSQQIRDHLEQHGLHGAGAAQFAAHQTRDEKLVSITHEEMRLKHRDVAAQFGNQPDRVIGEAQYRQVAEQSPEQKQQ